MKKIISICIAILGFIVGVVAHAGSVELSAECTWHAEAECYAGCNDFTFYGECESELQATCDISECRGAQINVDCQGACELDCASECAVDPGSFDCQGGCSADCQASCEGQCGANCEADCAADPDTASCEAACTASCSARCEGNCDVECTANCDVTEPSMDCEGKCQASCDASCQAKADIDCQIECESAAYANCEITASANCNSYCDAEGFLECNGDVIDQKKLDKFKAKVKSWFEAARAWVEANFAGTYSYDAEADGYCDKTGCYASAEAEFEGEVHTTCATVAPGQKTPSLINGLIHLF